LSHCCRRSFSSSPPLLVFLTLKNARWRLRSPVVNCQILRKRRAASARALPQGARSQSRPSRLVEPRSQPGAQPVAKREENRLERPETWVTQFRYRCLRAVQAKCWSEWQDLNLRPPRPERGALPDRGRHRFFSVELTLDPCCAIGAGARSGTSALSRPFGNCR
jgi:hypothetical protein